MRYTSQDRLRTGAGLVAHHHNHLPVFRDIAALRPIRVRLGTYDYWQLNEQRRRFQDIGTAPFLRLAQLIRARPQLPGRRHLSGVTLIGLRVGQTMTLLDSENVGGRVQVLAVQEPGNFYAGLYD